MVVTFPNQSSLVCRVPIYPQRVQASQILGFWSHKIISLSVLVFCTGNLQYWVLGPSGLYISGFILGTFKKLGSGWSRYIITAPPTSGPPSLPEPCSLGLFCLSLALSEPQGPDTVEPYTIPYILILYTYYTAVVSDTQNVLQNEIGHYLGPYSSLP